MKKREITKRIEKAAKAQGMEWTFKREGANHTVYSLDGLMIPVPRHNEIDNQMARQIFKECEPKLGKGWWR